MINVVIGNTESLCFSVLGSIILVNSKRTLEYLIRQLSRETEERGNDFLPRSDPWNEVEKKISLPVLRGM